MDNESKSRARKQRMNKKKYNNKYKPPPTQVTKVELDSNWDRYEQREPESPINSSTDFSILANAPIIHGSHFQFRTDKEIEVELSEPVTHPIFNLDLTLLEKSLSTIPFNIRSGIEDNYFSKSQHTVMTALSDKSIDYQNYLKHYQNKKQDVVFGSKGELSAAEANVHKVDDSPEHNIKTKSPNKQLSPEKKEETVEELEEWLDGILDE